VCGEISGDVDVPGGLIVKDELLAAFHKPPEEGSHTWFLGHLLVSPRRHVDHFGDLDPNEAARVGVVAARLAHALRASEAVERVYAAVIGTHVPHFHLHLLPRYEDTPAEVRWYAVDEWEGAPRGGPDQIAALVERVRVAY
jgi:histidine triad (HIT) family protein